MADESPKQEPEIKIPKEPEVKVPMSEDQKMLAAPIGEIIKAHEEKAKETQAEEWVETPEETFLFARNPVELQHAQDKLVKDLTKILDEHKDELEIAKSNLVITKKNRWRSSGLESLVKRCQQRVEYYEKAVAAVKAGYFLVPNFDIDVFAVRTTRKRVARHDAYGTYANPRPQESNRPPLEQGKYVSPDAHVLARQVNRGERDSEGKPKTTTHSWAHQFREVDFPFKMVKPAVLEATANALNAKIFDEIGILQNRGTSRPAKGDPMVVGRIFYPQGYGRKEMSFVIGWFVDTKEL